MPPQPPRLDSGWRPSARQDVDFRHVGGDWVLFDPVSQRIHVLDVTAALVWSYCTGEMDVSAMEREIRNAFGPALAAGRDPGVRKALADFEEADLLRRDP